MDKSKILHIITDLGPGGAQKYLCKLIGSDDQNTHYIYVIDSDIFLGSGSKNINIIYSKFNLFLFPL